ncbi:hypothetical protein D3C71_1426730 [compost metagenome]
MPVGPGAGQQRRPTRHVQGGLLAGCSRDAAAVSQLHLKTRQVRQRAGSHAALHRAVNGAIHVDDQRMTAHGRHGRLRRGGCFGLGRSRIRIVVAAAARGQCQRQHRGCGKTAPCGQAAVPVH